MINPSSRKRKKKEPPGQGGAVDQSQQFHEQKLKDVYFLKATALKITSEQMLLKFPISFSIKR